MSNHDAAAAAPQAVAHQYPPPAAGATADTPVGATVYVDAGALVARGLGDGRPGRLQPDAEPAMRHLRDARHPVVLTGAAGPVATVLAALRDAAPAATAELPDLATGWLVSNDPDVCAAARGIRGIRTILVGPAVPGRGLAYRRADMEARDLVDAVLAILAAEAMPDGPCERLG